MPSIGCSPNGRNINLNCGSTRPELLQATVRGVGADAGIALDGDGDRVVMVDANGDIVDGDQLIHILAAAAHRAGSLRGPVVGTIMSNLGLEQALGLVTELAKVPIEQRKGRDHTPQEKLIEFLVGIVGGIEHLQDLNLAEQPIARDPTVAEAWAQAIFAHYSGVSRTLDAGDEDTLVAVVKVLHSISRAFIDAAVLETIKEGETVWRRAAD